MNSIYQNIQVAVRCRPLTDSEKKQNYSETSSNHNQTKIYLRLKKNEIEVPQRNPGIPITKVFAFDKLFGPNSKQNEVYNQLVRPVVMEVIKGFNCTLIAYGQTNSGKTFTMEGDQSHEPFNDEMSWEEDSLAGIIPRSVSHLFSALNAMATCEYSLKISYVQLYNEELTDLLSDSNKELDIFDDLSRKGALLIPELCQIAVKSKNEVYKTLRECNERRLNASQLVTFQNIQSSCSHSIFMVTVYIKEKSRIDGEETIKVGKLNLIDLAGSENIKCLSPLDRVITALVEKRDHIPYNESKLTRILQDSLGGKTKATIIATISPAINNIEETIRTVGFAHRAKWIRNKPERNQEITPYQVEIIRMMNQQGKVVALELPDCINDSATTQTGENEFLKNSNDNDSIEHDQVMELLPEIDLNSSANL